MFGIRLAAERRRLRLSQKDVADRFGIVRSAVGMIETERAPLDAARLVQLGKEGFDVLYILTGEHGTTAAGRLVNWELVTSLINRIRDWEVARGRRIKPEKLAIVLKHLYLHYAERGDWDNSAFDDVLRMAA
jgi:transcriptional regulator with XRE-family HTH domain